MSVKNRIKHHRPVKSPTEDSLNQNQIHRLLDAGYSYGSGVWSPPGPGPHHQGAGSMAPPAHAGPQAASGAGNAGNAAAGGAGSVHNRRNPQLARAAQDRLKRYGRR